MTFNKISAGRILLFFAAIFWVFALTVKYYLFGYYDWDLSFFAQAMHNLTQGQLYSSLFERNFLGNHSNLIAFLIVPLYQIFSHPLTLVYLKIFSVFGAGWIICSLAEENLGSLPGLLIVAAYVFYPPNIFGLLYEFDMEALAPFFCAGLYYFFIKERSKEFWVCAIFLMLIKENLPLMISAAGIVGLFVKKQKWRWGFLPLITGILTFVVLSFMIVPHFAGRPVLSNHPYLAHYSSLGDSLPQIILNMFIHPIRTLEYIFSNQNIFWLLEIFGPLFFVPVLGFTALFFVLPIFIQHMLSSSWQEHTIFFSYMLTISPFIFLALIESFVILKKFLFNRILFIIGLCLVLNISLLNYYWPNMAGRYLPSYTQQWTETRQNFFMMIPKDASIIASFPFLAKLSNRSGLYSFYKVYNPDYNVEKPWDAPTDVRYALIDLTDPWYLNFLKRNPENTQKLIESFKERGSWEVIQSQGPIQLWKR